jgi:hypothetical protein
MLWWLIADSRPQEPAMPIEEIPGADLRYHLIAFDGEGREREDDPDGRMSARAIAAVRDEPVTDVFIMSHGWRADVPSAKRQYAAWIDAMLACRDDIARMKTRRPGFRPALIGLHWPSEPFGDEDLASPGVAFVAGGTPDAEALVDRYAARIADTPAAREALRTIAAALLADPAPATLPADVQGAYDVLLRESGLAAAPQASPVEPGEPFDAEAIYRTGWDEPVSFGETRLEDLFLLPLRLLSYRKMKDRAKQIGEGGGARLLAEVQAATGDGREVRVHLMGHSFGCIVVSAMIAGTQETAGAARPVRSLVLVQGAMSIWSLAPRIPAFPDRAGAFHRVVREGRVAGPILTTMSRFDSAVASFYPRVSWAGAWLPGGGSDQVSFVPGEEAWPAYAAIGSLGLRGDDLAIHDLEMLPADQPYDFEPGGIYNLQSAHIIREGGPPSGAHGDFLKREVGHAVWEAAW